MKTLTQEQFKKMYGEVGLAKFEQPIAPKKEGYFSNVANQVKGNVQEASQSLDASAMGRMNPLRAGVNIAKNVSGAVSAPLAQAPGFKQLGEGFGKVGQAVVDTPVGQKVTGYLSEKFSPETLGTISDVIETGLNVAGIEGTMRSVQGGFNKAKGIYNDIKNTPPGPDGGGGVDPQFTLKTAIEDATPNYELSTPTRRVKLLDRVEEGGTFKGRTVKSNALEAEAGSELSKVPGYDPKSTKLSKYQVTKSEIAKRGQNLETSLGNEKVLVPKREVTSRVQRVVNELPNKSLLLQSTDPVLVNYMRVFKNAFAKEMGNLKGVLKLRKALDDAYENARGKQAFGSDKISALDDVNTAVRNVLTEYMIEKAQTTNVKASLRSQWNLYRALDELKIAAEKESGSVVGRFNQKHPIIKKVGTMAANAVGIGQAVNLMP